MERLPGDYGIQHVFVDEAGSARLPRPGSTLDDVYVVCAILVSQEGLSEAERRAQQLVLKNAGKGELKSNKIARNIQRRIAVAREINACEFNTYCLVVNKTRIWRDTGLRWAPSFYKHLHKMVYSRLQRQYVGMSVLADNYGSSEFMAGFQDYIRSVGQLFDRVEFASSSEVPLLQVADIVAGTIRRALRGDDPPDAVEALGGPSLPIEHWPPSTGSLPKVAVHEADRWDHLVKTVAIDAAREFVESRVDQMDVDAKLQVHAIRYLLRRYYSDPLAYVFRAEIVEELHTTCGMRIADNVLSTRVLAPARDNGVVLCSTDKGVKIPYRAQDLKDWTTRVNAQVVPYLERLRKARNDILLASNRKYDIVDDQQFPELAKYFQAL